MKNDSESKNDLVESTVVSHEYEMRTMQLLLAEKDKNFRILSGLIHSNFEEIQQSLDELASGTQQLVKAIHDVSSSSNDLLGIIRIQREAVKNLVQNANAVSEYGVQNNEIQSIIGLEIEKLQTNSNSIKELILNIDDIAEQLGILSINGAIQAARNGESGKGFSVVTMEMRKLSDRVLSSTSNQKITIEGIINSIGKTGTSGKKMKEIALKSDTSIEVMHSAVKQLDIQIDQLTVHSESLSTTISEFSATIEEISRTIQSINNMIGRFHKSYSLETQLSSLVSDASEYFQNLARNSFSLEESAMKQMRTLYDRFQDADGKRLLSMCRIYIALPFDDLPEHYQERARENSSWRDTRYLCLIGTAGDAENWNRIEGSVGHKMIQLPKASRDLIKMPMLSKVFSSLGVDYAEIIKPEKSGTRRSIEGHYYENNAAESPYIPDKKFLQDYDIKTQLSIGGILPSGAIFTCFMFLKTILSENAAESIKILAPVLQLCFQSFDEKMAYWKNRKQ